MLGHRQRTVIAPGWEELLRAEGLDTVAGVYRLTAGQVFLRTGSTEVRRVELGSGPGARTVFIKKYWIGRTAQLWSGMFRGTFLGTPKARREYENLRLLRQWELDAPAPVAFGEERSAGWLMRSFLISEAVPDPMPLHVFIRDRLPSLPAAEAARERAKLLERLADATRRLHDRHFVHHDYFWRNILLSQARTEHFFLIDAHKGRSWYPGESRRARARDLAALDAPAAQFFRQTERLRFFLRYCGCQRLDRPAKRLLRLVLRLAAPMRDKQLRRVMGANRPG
jgi:tRNA A-37 threonylcarbamoyl transferase component Bud32